MKTVNGGNAPRFRNKAEISRFMANAVKTQKVLCEMFRIKSRHVEIVACLFVLWRRVNQMNPLRY